MSRYVYPSIAIIGLAFLAISTPNKSLSDEPAESGSSLAATSETFRGNILMVEVDRSSALESKSSTAVMKDAEILLIGDRYFVQGKGYAPDGYESSWYVDTVVGIAWANVTRYYVMTPDQFDNYAKRWDEREGESQ